MATTRMVLDYTVNSNALYDRRQPPGAVARLVKRGTGSGGSGKYRISCPGTAHELRRPIPAPGWNRESATGSLGSSQPFRQAKAGRSNKQGAAAFLYLAVARGLCCCCCCCCWPSNSSNDTTAPTMVMTTTTTTKTTPLLSQMTENRSAFCLSWFAGSLACSRKKELPLGSMTPCIFFLNSLSTINIRIPLHPSEYTYLISQRKLTTDTTERL